jgi:ADP-ribosylglycohydrolase
MAPTTSSRAAGCLVGLLVGDSLGSEVEFQKAAQIAASHPNGVRDMTSEGTWHTLPGQATDDGELALSLARSLDAEGRFDEQAIAGAYAAWYLSSPFDMGMTTRMALAPAGDAWRAGGDVAAACRSAQNLTSQANGALMRIAPLAIFGARASREDLVRWSRADATLTHPHVVCQDANAAYVVAIASLIAPASASEGSGEQAYALALQHARDSNADASITRTIERAEHAPPERCDGEHQGWVLIALQNAFYRLLHARSVEEALVETISQGGDSDTNGAICGALVGAAWGLEAIPERWRQAVRTCTPEQGGEGVKRPRPAVYWPHDAEQLAARLLGDAAGD